MFFFFFGTLFVDIDFKLSSAVTVRLSEQNHRPAAFRTMGWMLKVGE